jgi:hypothetical protein
MKIKKRRSKASPAVSARVLVTELTRNLEEAFARSDASAVADALYKRATEHGEPVSPDLMRYMSEQSRGGAPSKLLEAIPVIQNEKRRTAKLRVKNRERQHKAETERQQFQLMAGKLIADDPQLRRKKANYLATIISKKLGNVSVRTVARALKKK